MLPVWREPSQFTSARWVSVPQAKVDAFAQANQQHMARDNDDDIVFLTRLQWDIDRVARDYPGVPLTAAKEMLV